MLHFQVAIVLVNIRQLSFSIDSFVYIHDFKKCCHFAHKLSIILNMVNILDDSCFMLGCFWYELYVLCEFARPFSLYLNEIFLT